MNQQLTAAQQAVAKLAHDFADEFIDPIVTELDRGVVFPKALIGQLAAQGLLGLVLPKQSSVAGAGFVSHIEVVQALSRSCPAIASVINNHALFAYALEHWGSDAQKKQYLPALAKGDKLGAIAIQEEGPTPGVGRSALVSN